VAIIETTRNEQGEFVALYVRENSLQEEFDGFRSDLREACDDFLNDFLNDFRNDLREMFARLNRALLAAGIVVTVAGSACIYLMAILVGGK